MNYLEFDKEFNTKREKIWSLADLLCYDLKHIFLNKNTGSDIRYLVKDCEEIKGHLLDLEKFYLEQENINDRS